MADETARLTADVVLFSDDTDGVRHVLLIRRGKAPFTGCWALPGGHVEAGEKTVTAALRELTEETGLVLGPNALDLAGVWAEPGRDPRGRYVTFAYTADVPGLPNVEADDDATETWWVPVEDVLNDPSEIAFDHEHIIRQAFWYMDENG